MTLPYVIMVLAVLAESVECSAISKSRGVLLVAVASVPMPRLSQMNGNRRGREVSTRTAVVPACARR